MQTLKNVMNTLTHYNKEKKDIKIITKYLHNSKIIYIFAL